MNTVPTAVMADPPSMLVERGAELLDEGLALAEAFRSWARRASQFESAVSVVAPPLDGVPPQVIDERDDRWAYVTHLTAVMDVRGWIGCLATEPIGQPDPDVYAVPYRVLQRCIEEHGELVERAS